ncbi:MAG: hypothetical protein U9Q82_13535 [Chloroflexota bacterium]|nr:hypothetical protein [Chloroflexota bacterium]
MLFPKLQLEIKFIIPAIGRFQRNFTEDGLLLGLDEVPLDQLQHG